MERLIPRG